MVGFCYTSHRESFSGALGVSKDWVNSKFYKFKAEKRLLSGTFPVKGPPGGGARASPGAPPAPDRGPTGPCSRGRAGPDGHTAPVPHGGGAAGPLRARLRGARAWAPRAPRGTRGPRPGPAGHGAAAGRRAPGTGRTPGAGEVGTVHSAVSPPAPPGLGSELCAPPALGRGCAEGTAAGCGGSGRPALERPRSAAERAAEMAFSSLFSCPRINRRKK